MDPQQELFTELLTEIKALGCDVYDGFLPPDGTPYPFVYLADSQQIKSACRRLDHTENFAWNVRNVNQRILPDTTTKQPLLHGVLEIEFKFS